MPKNEWIPVEERLPEEKKDVMVTVRDSFTGELFVSIDSYWGKDKNGEWLSFIYDVVAWAEIPKPYEVKDGSD